MTEDWSRLTEIAQAEVAETLAGLPADLKDRACALPIVYEPVPNKAMVEDGLDPDTLGLFVGPDFADEHLGPLPPQVILFLENIWDMVEADEEEFRFEVRTTLMHELGHYLGLDEEELDERGLL
jgi:predicted Zn-dependent protease with MMP-like domain